MEEKFRSAVLFSGGGFRIGVYLGIYAALNDMDNQPELIIASCGGAISSVIINMFDTDILRKNYLLSEELYSYFNEISVTKKSFLHRLPLKLMILKIKKGKTKKVLDIIDNYLVKLPKFFFTKAIDFNQNRVKTIILGSKIIYDNKDIGCKICKKLFKPILFTDSATRNKIKKLLPQEEYLKDSHVIPTYDIIDCFKMEEAARISISDMFYMPTFKKNKDNYSGGAINLMPLELAKSVASSLLMEYKQEYSSIGASVIKAIFGYDGYERMRMVHDKHANYWIDTSDAPKKLKGYFITTSINWKKFRVELVKPKNYNEYKIWMEKQWEYGYNRAVEALKLAKNSKNHVRNKNIFNCLEELLNER